MSKDIEEQFWKTKDMHKMTSEEWESLCDGCARCCVYKTEDEETGEVEYLPIACPLLDLETCRCTNYENRQQLESDCVKITPENINELSWLPDTCAYKLIAAGKDLPTWHPLVTGDSESTKNMGMSVRNRVVHASDIQFNERN